MDNKKDKKHLKTHIDEINHLKVELEKLKKERDGYKNKYLRALADYQNLEKRIIEDRQEVLKDANKQLILKLLTFLDNLDKAEVFVKDHGLKMAKDNFFQLLKNEGLEEIQILGKEFNPHLAEVIDVVKGEKDNIVVGVLRKGYKLNDKIVRVAQVKVSKKIISKETAESKEELLKGNYM